MLELIPAISWPGGSPENTGIIVGVIVGAYVGAVWLAALIWTIRDIRDRSEDPITQVIGFLIVFVFNLPGWVLYLVLRPPLTLAEVYERQLEEEALRLELDTRLACPTCEHEVEDDYMACPGCATRLKTPCRQCERAVSFSWAACPWCGTRQGEGAAPRVEPAGAPELASVAPETTAAQSEVNGDGAAPTTHPSFRPPSSLGGARSIRPSAQSDAVGSRPSPFRRGASELGESEFEAQPAQTGSGD